MKKPPTRTVRKIQRYLFEYLSIDLDPYDFPRYFLEEWAQEAGVELDEDDHADALTPEQLKAYEEWLLRESKDYEWVERDPFYSAPYLTFSLPERMPIGTWAIHFTNESPFDVFRKGATLEGLHLSTWSKDKESVDCGKNLDLNQGLFEYVWVFAFDALLGPHGRGHVLSYGKSKYGRNAILFQTDGAVAADHDGDEERQLILPACSEYNVVPLYDPEPGAVSCALKNEEEATFESLKDLIAYLEKDGKQKVGQRIKTLDC